MYIHYIALNCEQKPGFIEERKHGLIDLLFLRFHSNTTLILGDKTYTITKPCVFLIDSNMPYKYFSNSTDYRDDYLHFAAENRQQFLSELTFPLNTPIYISNNNAITDYLTLIQAEQMSKNRLAAKSIDLLIRCLFIKVSEEWLQSRQTNTSVPHYYELLRVRDAILASPERSWKIEELAELAHLSPSYFQVIYKKAFGITCMTEVINAKIEQAKLLLTSTELTVSAVAAETGYNEVYHFIRQFKKSTGMTPGAFRKKVVL
ncbi:MAG: helix-turn-helix transcriptional regulator [Lachnospiraceae bacterium]|nr:helix-turn-helix transcriptional regulator [Lachnospiraceae bacterium]